MMKDKQKDGKKTLKEENMKSGSLMLLIVSSWSGFPVRVLVLVLLIFVPVTGIKEYDESFNDDETRERPCATTTLHPETRSGGDGGGAGDGSGGEGGRFCGGGFVGGEDGGDGGGGGAGRG